jgi:fructose-bisphosphate aldolase class I
VRAAEYYAAGCRFAKWRSPLTIGADGDISDLCIKANMEDLARYALICQSEGLMPIVEPDIVLLGDYDLETAVDVNTKVQAALYKSMVDHGVWMEGSTLKPNMVNPGKACPKTYTCEEIGEATIAVLRRVMPAAMRGVNFLSGGQSLENAAARLSSINKAKGNSPWNLSFSWSQALQLPLLELCKKYPKGSPLPLEEMSELLTMELAIAGAAARGEYDASPGQGDHQGVSPVTPVDMTDKGTGTLDRDGTKTGGFFAGLFGK